MEVSARERLEDERAVIVQSRLSSVVLPDLMLLWAVRPIRKGGNGKPSMTEVECSTGLADVGNPMTHSI